MDFSTLFRIKENLNLDKNTLTILRYIAIFGQLIAINIVFFYLKLSFPIVESYIVIFFGLLTNLFLQLKVKVNQLKDTHASLFLLFDLLQLSMLLYLTGGILNPFSILLIIPTIVSSTFLSMGTTIILGTLTTGLLFFLKEYHQNIGKNIESLKKALKKDYASVVKHKATEHDSFRFKEIMNSYRPGMNPVRAMYYQAREVTRRYNPEHPYHYWLIDLITDKEYNNIILDALAKDVKKLEKIIARYYFPLVKNSRGVPLELFHAKQQLKDFKYYYLFFRNIKDWSPDE